MKRPRWTVHARNEARAAADWYREQNPYAAERFEGMLRAALADVCEAPRRWPVWRATTNRRYIGPQFPFSIIYCLLDDDRVLVVAIFHHRRDPDRRFSP